MGEDNKTEKNTFGELDKIKYIIVRDAKKEVLGWLIKYGSPAAIIITVLSFIGYGWIRDFYNAKIIEAKEKITRETNIMVDSLKTQIYAKIKLAYTETNIEPIVDSLIEKDARAIITNKVKEEFQPILNDLERDRNKYNELLTLHELAINAEGGDKISFKKLKNYFFSQNPDYQQFSKRIINKIQTKYYDISMYQVPGTNDPDSIRKYLKSDSSHDRVLAVNIIMSDSILDFIPDLIAMIDDEPDIEVEACIFRTLNRFFDMHFDLLDDRAVNEYTKKWLVLQNERMKIRN